MSIRAPIFLLWWIAFVALASELPFHKAVEFHGKLSPEDNVSIDDEAPLDRDVTITENDLRDFIENEIGLESVSDEDIQELRRKLVVDLPLELDRQVRSVDVIKRGETTTFKRVNTKTLLQNLLNQLEPSDVDSPIRQRDKGDKDLHDFVSSFFDGGNERASSLKKSRSRDHSHDSPDDRISVSRASRNYDCYDQTVACRCEYPGENVYRTSRDSSDTASTPGTSSLLDRFTSFRDRRFQDGELTTRSNFNWRRQLGKEKNKDKRFLASRNQVRADDFRVVNGERIISRNCNICRNVQYRCPGEPLDCPLWNYQCSVTIYPDRPATGSRPAPYDYGMGVMSGKGMGASKSYYHGMGKPKGASKSYYYGIGMMGGKHKSASKSYDYGMDMLGGKGMGASKSYYRGRGLSGSEGSHREAHRVPRGLDSDDIELEISAGNRIVRRILAPRNLRPSSGPSKARDLRIISNPRIPGAQGSGVFTLSDNLDDILDQMKDPSPTTDPSDSESHGDKVSVPSNEDVITNPRNPGAQSSGAFTLTNNLSDILDQLKGPSSTTGPTDSEQDVDRISVPSNQDVASIGTHYTLADDLSSILIDRKPNRNDEVRGGGGNYDSSCRIVVLPADHPQCTRDLDCEPHGIPFRPSGSYGFDSYGKGKGRGKGGGKGGRPQMMMMMMMDFDRPPTRCPFPTPTANDKPPSVERPSRPILEMPIFRPPSRPSVIPPTLRPPGLFPPSVLRPTTGPEGLPPGLFPPSVLRPTTGPGGLPPSPTDLDRVPTETPTESPEPSPSPTTVPTEFQKAAPVPGFTSQPTAIQSVSTLPSENPTASVPTPFPVSTILS
jgi:hypothetical protein